MEGAVATVEVLGEIPYPESMNKARSYQVRVGDHLYQAWCWYGTRWHVRMALKLDAVCCPEQISLEPHLLREVKRAVNEYEARLLERSGGVRRIDPRGCGCTDCITPDGYSVPIDDATPEQLELLHLGRLDNASGMKPDVKVTWGY